MNIKSVVKVMNFHALLRVERSRKEAIRLQEMEEALLDMMIIITNNKNIQLDKKIGKTNAKLPVLTVYLGSDFGFCGSVNSSVNYQMAKDQEKNMDRIVVGKKLNHSDHVEMYLSHEDYDKDFSRMDEYLREAVVGNKWSAIDLVYNHFYNLSSIKPEKRRIYPLPEIKKDNFNEYEDFVFEGDADELLQNLIHLYLECEFKIAIASAYASENTMRQNATTESLKKLDEREIEEKREIRKKNTQKAFKKTIDSYVNQKSLNKTN